MWFWQRKTAENRQRQQQMNRLLAAYQKNQSFSGVVRVMRRGEVIFEAAAGCADVEAGRPNTLAHTYRIASVSKPFTALAVMQLVEQRRLDLNAPVARFVSGCSGGEAVCVRHLLNNSSGIPDYLMLEGADAWYTQRATPASLIDHFRDLPLLFAPGSRLGYSNSNFVLLAAILEEVSGEQYGAYLRRHLLDPLGMTQTGHETPDTPPVSLARGYSLRDGKPLPAMPIDPSVCIGGGSLYATAADLGRLDRGLAQSALWQPQTLAAMWSPLLKADDGSHYGLGLQVGERFGRVWNGHAGSTFGYTAFFTRYPADDALVVVLSNYDNGSAARIEQDLAAILFDQPYTLPEGRVFVQLAPEHLVRCTGRYLSSFMGRQMPFDVTLEEGELYVKFALLPKAHLRATAHNRFFTHLKGGEVEFVFAGPASEPSTHVDMDWSGYASSAPRLKEQKAA